METEREIGGVMYKTRPLPFDDGLPLLKRLIDIAAPLIAAGLRGGASPRGAANVLDVLPANLTLADINTFRKAFGAVSHYQNEGGTWQGLPYDAKNNGQTIHFAGRYVEFAQWLAFCVEVNFAGFFTGANVGAEKIKALLREVLAQSKSTPGSTSNSDSSPTPQ